MSEARQPTLWQRLRNTPKRDLIRGRVSQRMDWRGPLGCAQLPDEAKRLLTKLIKRTRLWRLEKADLAHELIAHFEDALAEGQSFEEATQAFGDWRRAAKLIRRAKKRNRSLLWQAWRRTFWAGVVLIVCYVGFGLYLLTDSVQVNVDYQQMMNADAAAVPQADRAWPVLREALIAIKADPAFTDMPPDDEAFAADPLDETAEMTVQALVNSQVRPGEAQWPRLQVFLQAHQGDLASIREAAAMPGLGYIAGHEWALEDLPLFYPKADPVEYARRLRQLESAQIPPPVVNVLLPQLSELRAAERLLIADARYAMARGDMQTAYLDLLAIYDLAGHADEQRMLINQLVTIAITIDGHRLASEIIAHDPSALTDHQLTALAHRVAAIRQYPLDYASERWAMHDFIQRIYTDDGRGGGYFDLRGWGNYFNGYEDAFSETNGPPEGAYQPVFSRAVRLSAMPAASLYAADRQEMTQVTDRLFDEYQAELAVPMWQQPESMVEAELIELSTQSPLARMRYPMLFELMPSLAAMRKNTERFVAYSDGLLTGIALELYQREHDRYPESLGTIVPRYLPEVPIDRITGAPLNYTLIDGRPVLYSFGTDRDDDGGRIQRTSHGSQDMNVMLWDPEGVYIDEYYQGYDADWIVWPLHDPPRPGIDD